MHDPKHYPSAMPQRALCAQEDAQSWCRLEGNIDGPRLLIGLKMLPDSLLTPLLWSFRGMTDGEIAGRLGLSIGTTRGRLLRAQARLVHFIEQVEA
jgi:hypothetical protein